jgi:Arc/MetJ-type ribon-helix-helix transcriptional regulator
MSHKLAPDIWDEIQRQISMEGYSSTYEVLRDALAALRREEDLRAIQAGIDDMKAGRVTPLEDFDRAFRRESGMPAGG